MALWRIAKVRSSLNQTIVLIKPTCSVDEFESALEHISIDVISKAFIIIQQGLYWNVVCKGVDGDK